MILIVFPLGLLATAVVFDVLTLLIGGLIPPLVAYWMIASGIIGGLLAAPFGWIDWFAIPSGTRAKAVGLAHGLTNVTVLILFAVSWLLGHGCGTEHTSISPFLCGCRFGGDRWLAGRRVG